MNQSDTLRFWICSFPEEHYYQINKITKQKKKKFQELKQNLKSSIDSFESLMLSLLIHKFSIQEKI